MREKRNQRRFSPNRSPGSGGSPKKPPPIDTRAEIYYYRKQIEAQTEMVIVLQDGEEIRGTIEWYDQKALKIIRQGFPNLLLLRHNIKYLFKATELV